MASSQSVINFFHGYTLQTYAVSKLFTWYSQYKNGESILFFFLFNNKAVIVLVLGLFIDEACNEIMKFQVT